MESQPEPDSSPWAQSEFERTERNQGKRGNGAFGQVVTATLPNGVTTSYGYDTAQRQTSISHTLSSQTLDYLFRS